MSCMNLVVGATGVLGTELCRQLRALGKPVRALVRKTADPAKVERLRALGVDHAVGDLKEPPTVDAALAGVKTVLSTATMIISSQPGDSFSAVDDQGQRTLVDRA